MSRPISGVGVAGPSLGTIGGLLSRQAEIAPDSPYLYFEDDVITWAELDEDVSRTARALHDLGVRPGDRVAVLMRNRPEYLLAWLGAVRLGAVYVPIIADNKPPEVDYVLQRSGSKALITTGELLAPLGDVRNRCPELEHIAAVDRLPATDDRVLPFTEMVAAVSPSVPGSGPGEQDIAQIAFTSGTTNRPKGIVHTHHPYVRIGCELARRMNYSPEDRLMVVLPLFHGNAQITSFMASLAARTTAALIPRFSVSRFWDQVDRYQPTEVNLLTGLQLMLLGRPAAEGERTHSLQVVFGTTTESVQQRFLERFGVPTVTTWSLTECSLGTVGARGEPYIPEWVGTPLGGENEIAIVDEHDRRRAPGEVGEIIIRNSCVMQEYFRQPEVTAEALRGRWLHTGDRGYMDGQGNLYFKGRIKHVIRRSGENISGEEVEDTVTSHPAVQECAAIAVPDDVRVEEVKVYVVLNEGASLTEEEIIDWCEDRLATFKTPRYIEFRSSLPMTPRGTVRRFVLAEEENPGSGWDRLRVGYRLDWRPEWVMGQANDITLADPRKGD
jgi:crotonobetaine/carnitine-CoA ligase